MKIKGVEIRVPGDILAALFPERFWSEREFLEWCSKMGPAGLMASGLAPWECREKLERKYGARDVR